ncbi:MAG TPA: DUF5996 family protein [candidate division Zixibacteria bacterium]|nr:DUF5996 family protein [candidate division Zixibacteria bacterium]
MNLAEEREKQWPALPSSWKDTCATLHMWTQMVGKVRLALTPLVNHWWNVPLYVNARGLTTSAISYLGSSFELTFDFVNHELVLLMTDHQPTMIPLRSISVAQFYAEFTRLLSDALIEVRIWPMPVEIPNPIPFDEDRVHKTYDPAAARNFWRILLSTQAVFEEFRSHFIGKCSPVHFFWGSFDLAVTRFSGRRAPERPGADRITREAYSHEVSSVGFWPGNAGVAADPIFYSYTSPEPQGFRDARVHPEGAVYDTTMGEFVLPYEVMRNSPMPGAALLDFCQSTYEAGASLGQWDRESLERRPARVLDKTA